jgi:hypothetical protein
MRQILAFLFACGLIAVGGYIILKNIEYRGYMNFRSWGMALILMGIGAAWLWADFVGPLFRVQREKLRRIF